MSYVFWEVGDGKKYTEDKSINNVIVSEGVVKLEGGVDDFGREIGAFYDCSNLWTVGLPDSLKRVGGWSFSYCSALQKVHLPGSVIDIGEHAFLGCQSLKLVTLSEGLTCIPKGLFSECESLESVELPLALTAIGDNAFSNCSSLASINLNALEELTILGKGAFDSCVSLRALDLPPYLTKINGNTFRDCEKLASVKLPPSLEKISDNAAFSGCSDSLCIEVPETLRRSVYEQLLMSRSKEGKKTVVKVLNASGDVLKVIEVEGKKNGAKKEKNSGLNHQLGDYNHGEAKKSSGFNQLDNYNHGELEKSIGLERQLDSDANGEPEMNSGFNHELGNYNNGEPEKNSGLESQLDSDARCEPEKNSSLERQLDDYNHGEANKNNGLNRQMDNDNESNQEVIWKTGDGLKYYKNETITSATVADGVEHLASRVLSHRGYEMGVFGNCRSLRIVKLPESLRTIGNLSFSNCESLMELHMPSGVIEIGPRAFRLCVSLERVNFPCGIVNIPEQLFRGCKSLKTVMLPASLTTIQKGAFSGCSALAALNLAPLPSLCYIGSSCFAHCTSLATFRFPPSVTTILVGTFENCSSLANVRLPRSLREIHKGVFKGVTSRVCFDVPDTVVTGVVHKLRNFVAKKGWIVNVISEMYSNGTFSKSSPPLTVGGGGGRAVGTVGGGGAAGPGGPVCSRDLSNGSGGNDNAARKPSVLWSPRDATKYYKNENITSAIVSFGATDLSTGEYHRSGKEKGVFSGCCSLLSVKLPETLKMIGCMAFFSCVSLKHIDIPSGLNEIGDQAFEYCESLVDVTLPQGVVDLPCRIFRGCKALKTVRLPISVKRIGASAFADCHSITALNLMELKGLSYIGNRAFEFCSSLSAFKFPPSVTTIETLTFSNCKKLVNVKLPPSLTMIEDDAFKDCTPGIRLRVPSGARDAVARYPWSSHTTEGDLSKDKDDKSGDTVSKKSAKKSPPQRQESQYGLFDLSSIAKRKICKKMNGRTIGLENDWIVYMDKNKCEYYVVAPDGKQFTSKRKALEYFEECGKRNEPLSPGNQGASRAGRREKC